MTLRVGLIGLDRTGTHLLERLRLRPVFHVAAVFDPDPSRSEAVSHLAETTTASLDETLAVPANMIVVAGPVADRAGWAAAALAAGRHVVLAPPVAPDVGSARELLTLADRARRRLGVLRLDHEQGEFLTAHAVAVCGLLGELRTVRRSVASAGLVGTGENPWDTFAPTDFAQALDLLAAAEMSSPLSSADGREGSLRVLFVSRVPGMDGECGGYLAVFQSPEGVLVEVSRNLRAVLPEDTGWRLSGSKGGYAHGSRFVRGDDDEIYDLPVEAPTPPDPLDVLRAVVEDDSDAWRTEYLRAVAVVRLLAVR
jgi:hypothetical protein